MKALDTNILVRRVVRDNPEQAEAADHEVRTGENMVTHTVLMEVEWVLRSSYKMSRQAIANAFAALMLIENLYFDDEEIVLRALEAHVQGADFADAVHLALSKKTDEFVTFDQALFKRSGSGVPPVRLL